MTDYRACRLPRHPGPAGWNEILPARAPNPPLEGGITADVAIIGAGFAGLSAARRLAELDPALRVVVLEASDLAQGAAGRNSGFMIDLPHDLSSDSYAHGNDDGDRKTIDANRLALSFAHGLAEEARLPREDFDPSGKINAAASEIGEAQNADYARHLEKMGEPSTALSETDMKDLTGTEFYRSGLHTPGAVIIQPAAYIRALAGALGSSVNVFENAPVKRFRKEGSTWRIETGKGAVSAARLILAVNGHAENFGLFSRRLLHVFTYASMTRALTSDEVRRLGGEARWGVTPADPMGTTVRRISGTGGDRIVTRVRFTSDPTMEISDRRLARVGRTHDEKFRDRFPMLGEVGTEYRWAGHLCLSLNGTQAFGEIEEGLVSACCQNGLGTVRGTLSGIAAAEVALGRPGAAAEAMSGQPAPKRLPPEPFAWIGANATMRWKEWRAGRE